MGRIAWFDSHARKYVGTSAALTAFNDYTLAPLVRDLIANTWMHERWVYSVCCMVYGVWCMVYGVWCTVYVFTCEPCSVVLLCNIMRAYGGHVCMKV